MTEHKKPSPEAYRSPPSSAATSDECRTAETTVPWTRPSQAPTGDQSRLTPGQVLADRYRIRKLLGSGGMADVYDAWDLELDEAVAVKVLQADISHRHGMLDRFKKEIKLARKIVHPNVCRIYDFGASKSVKFVTMELLRGSTIDVHTARDPSCHLEARIGMFREILAGLEAAHQMGIIHRDLKPQNVMVTPEGRAVIMDFGIARELHTNETTTAVGDILGTPAYMAPERLLGKSVDLRSDIYSLGVMLFELATGRRPFSGVTVFDMARNQLSIDPPLPTVLEPNLPGWLEKIILKMLAKSPDDRYQTVAEVQADLPTSDKVKTVLLVDDDATMLSIVGVHLNQAGISVVTATNGAAGIEMMLSKAPDLLCLDFTMPQMDGFQVADYLHRQGSKIPIFMLTGMQDPQYEKQAARLGIEQFFTKPLDVENLVRAVTRRLASV